jgi:hypothetical protein
MLSAPAYILWNYLAKTQPEKPQDPRAWPQELFQLFIGSHVQVTFGLIFLSNRANVLHHHNLTALLSLL